MPWQTQWITWNLVQWDMFHLALMPGNAWPLVGTSIGPYQSSEELLGSSLAKRQPRLTEGLCLGAVMRWLRLLSDHPAESALDRLNRLEADPKAAAAIQFLHIETRPNLADPLHDMRFYGEYLESLSRVSRLQFDFVFSINFPSSIGGSIQFMNRLERNRVYFLRLHSIKLESMMPCLVGHALAMATIADHKTRVFDVKFGEFEISEHELERFLSDYWQAEASLGHSYQELAAYEVRKSSLPNSR